jgi:hypothetical protein
VKLLDYTPRVFIIAWKEDTTQLEAYLSREGFDCEVLRQVHMPEYATCARSYLAMLNHETAWKRIAQEQRPAIVLEADFVPVKAFSQLLLPFDPTWEDVGMAWLYTCAAQIYEVSESGYAQGFSSSAVAYVMTPRAVQPLLEFADKEVRAVYGGDRYYSWDSELDTMLLRQGLRNFVPFRNFGEHGNSNPNPEHQQQGLGRTHRADILYGPLAFQPDYGSHEGYLKTRLYARLKGAARLLYGRYVRSHIWKTAESPYRLFRFALLRHLTPYL